MCVAFLLSFAMATVPRTLKCQRSVFVTCSNDIIMQWCCTVKLERGHMYCVSVIILLWV